jgi:hypothetical protein
LHSSRYPRHGVDFGEKATPQHIVFSLQLIWKAHLLRCTTNGKECRRLHQKNVHPLLDVEIVDEINEICVEADMKQPNEVDL